MSEAVQNGPDAPKSKPNADRPVMVFIVAGQSNAVGYNDIREYRKGREGFPEGFRNQPQVLFWPGQWARSDLKTPGRRFRRGPCTWPTMRSRSF